MKLKITYKPVASLIRNERNARLHSREQVTAIANSIRQFGFTNPILLDADDILIAGHGRLEAALQLGLEEVPAINLGHLTEAQRRAYAIADNKIPLQAEWDIDLLISELNALDVDGFDLTTTGFNTSELDALLKEVDALTSSIAPPSLQAAPSQRENEPLDEYPDIPEPKRQEERQPQASDDNYSVFELVMLHENKLQLVEALNDLRQDKHYEKIEEALMHLVRAYNQGKLDD